MSDIPNEEETTKIHVEFQVGNYDVVEGVSKLNPIQVVDGVLLLTNPRGLTIAAYAPGVWAWASPFEGEKK